MNTSKSIKVELEDYILFDKLNTLAIEYTTTIDQLTNMAIRRLVDDVEFFKGLRNITRPDVQT